MSVGANSYGAATDVAVLTGKFTSSGAFTTGTHPTLAQVEGWIDQVSATLNILLAKQGFTIPISQADCVLALKLFVVTAVADLVNYANSAGRFFQDKNMKTGPWQAIQKEAAAFIEKEAAGLEELGATRNHKMSAGLKTTTKTDSGETIEPAFDRRQFSNMNTDWDTS